jgi:hypothetical protein
MKKIMIEDIINAWSDIIKNLEQKNSKIAHFLEEAKLSSFDGKQLLIELDGHRFHLKTLEADAGLLEGAMNEILKQNIKIKFYLKGDMIIEEIQPQLIMPNYCFNCGTKLKEKE